MPRAVLHTTAVLVVLAAVGGFRLGQQKLDFSETSGVIEAVAQRHVAEHGGAITDCLGWLGAGGAALNVRCGDMLYRVDPLGRVRKVPEGDV